MRTAAGVGLLALTVLLLFRALGVWWSDALIWPLVLAASGAALIWRHSTTRAATEAAEPRPARVRRHRGRYRGGFGIALVIGAALLFLYANGAFEQVQDAALGAIVVLVALALILAPFWWRLGRNLAAEREQRIRSQERAELAAHLHDSVLQTLALVQKRAGDPKQVAALARRQERELRTWLNGESRMDGGLAAALQAAAVDVEDTHGVPIDVVAVGDSPLDEDGRALVAAAREAMVNAAKFAGGNVAVYTEIDEHGVHVFVHDRGRGFDLDAVPGDRRGVRESIIGRMERHGGRAMIRSTPAGTEVELVMERT
jgi:signal transduction histidine kinase